MIEINESLQKKVGLEKLYPWILEDRPTVAGREIIGCYLNSGCDDYILINSRLTANQRVLVYLHEAAHQVASPYLASLVSSGLHNQFFATLVAVMYRRIDKLEYVKIYDFFDTDDGQSFYRKSGARECSDAELIRRFNFIITESSCYASTTLSIEKIAADLWRSHPPEKWGEQAPEKCGEQAPEKRLISDLVLAAVCGGLLSSTVLWGAIWLSYFAQSSSLLKSLFA